MSFISFKNIGAEFEACPHPLLLPTVAVELSLELSVSRLSEYQAILEQMETSTGHGLERSPRNTTDREELQDYRTPVKELSKARSGVHLAFATLRSTMWTTEFVLKKMCWVDGGLEARTREALEKVAATRVLTERVEFVQSTIQHALLRGGVQERLEGQHATLFNLITQNDTLLSTSIAQDSREIAAATKRDSSSMKILAFLTTFFFPATFVAVRLYNHSYLFPV
ncbi:hypothetical protein BJX64DRAFT_260015 [Aspergillus heterothallicus]